MIDLKCGDCLEIMKQIPDKSIDLVLTDPPYNIGVNTEHNGHKIMNKWDKIPNYIGWSLTWLKECQRILKNTGVFRRCDSAAWRQQFPGTGQPLITMHSPPR